MSTLANTENRVLMAQARESLKGKWGLGVGTTVVFMLVMIAVQFIPVAGGIISLLITGPMSIGLAIFALSLSRKQDAKLSQIFSGFRKLGVGLGAYLLQLIFIILWSLLLIIPGIIAAISYSMTYYIIADNDLIGPLESITKSKEMMRGNKWKFFCLGFRFFGWALLCILTLGIGCLWLFPYMIVSLAQFYDDLKESNGITVEPRSWQLILEQSTMKCPQCMKRSQREAKICRFCNFKFIPLPPIVPGLQPQDYDQQLRRLAKLKEDGIISAEEFDKKKYALLGL